VKAIVTVALKEGVLDPEAKAITHALAGLGFEGVREVRTARVFELDLAETDAARARESAEAMGRRLLANTVIERFAVRLEGEP
jgi:phosphoribosylformylglycinamidine synthase